MTEVIKKYVHKYVCTNIFDMYLYIHKKVFAEVHHFVQSALDGFNVSLLAYGQTGAGKTWSMMGGNQVCDCHFFSHAFLCVFLLCLYVCASVQRCVFLVCFCITCLFAGVCVSIVCVSV